MDILRGRAKKKARSRLAKYKKCTDLPTLLVASNDRLSPRVSPADFVLDPVAFHAGLGDNQHKLVVQTNGFVDLPVDFSPSLYVMRGKPAAHALVLEVSMQCDYEK
jgi:hypothetical protein